MDNCIVADDGQMPAAAAEEAGFCANKDKTAASGAESEEAERDDSSSAMEGATEKHVTFLLSEKAESFGGYSLSRAHRFGSD